MLGGIQIFPFSCTHDQTNDTFFFFKIFFLTHWFIYALDNPVGHLKIELKSLIWTSVGVT